MEFVLLAAFLLMAITPSQPDAADRVLKLVLFGWCSAERSPIVDVPRDVAERLEVVSRRCDEFKSRKPEPQNARSAEDLAEHARWGYEARLFALARRDPAFAATQAYVSDLRPCYEWEGYHDCPEREAAFADGYFAAHSSSPFAEYLPLLAAHRWQCAADAYEYEARNHVQLQTGSVGLTVARARATADLAKALGSRDPLVRFAANTLQKTGGCF